MARFVGVDIRSSHIRAALVRTGYKSVAIESLAEVDRSQFPTLAQAVQACVLPLSQHTDGIATAIDGEVAFIHRISIPPTAVKQLAEVLPFELEAQVPVDLEELVYDYMSLPRIDSSEPVTVLTASARVEVVSEHIDLIREATGREPERVGCGAISLANLATVCPLLGAAGPIAFADLGRDNTDVLVMAGGRPIFARTVSVGVGGLPQSAPRLAAALRQTFAAAGVRAGQPVLVLYLLGGGAAAPGAEAYLSTELGLPVEKLPPLDFDDMTVEQIEFAPRFAKALSLALGLRSNPRDLDLRRGPLSFQRGFGFLKEKAPILAGLSATVLVSFFFASWAELRSLSYENEGLGEALAALTKRAFDEETSDPERALELLDQRSKGAERDPMPKMDAFDVMVELSKAVPESVVHDVEELDMQREQVKIKGVVGTTAEAQQVADNLKKQPCFKDAKISKVTQAVNSSQQKYVLEFPVKCEEEPKKKKQAEEGEGEEGKEAEDKEAKDKKETEDDEN